MPLFGNKDSKRAADERAYNSGTPGQGIINDSNSYNNSNTVNDGNAYSGHQPTSNLSPNSPPDQRSGATNLGGHQYQDVNADHPHRHGHGTNNNAASMTHPNDMTNVHNAGATPTQNFDHTAGAPVSNLPGGAQNYNNDNYNTGAQGLTHPHHNNHPGATALGAGAAAGTAGYAAGHHGTHGNTGLNPATGRYTNPDYNNPTEAQIQLQSGQVPSKGNILKQEYMGKLENAAGVLLSSESMKQRGAQKEMEALAMKKQTTELSQAQRLEHEATIRRDRAVAHGAHPHHSALGANAQGPNAVPGSVGGNVSTMPGQGGMGARY